MTDTITGRENIILSFPEELDNKEWEELLEILPGEFFLYAVCQNVFTGDLTSLNEVQEVMQDSIENSPTPILDVDEADQLLHKMFGIFSDVFTDLFAEIVPDHLPTGIEIKYVIYDDLNKDIYIIFNEDSETSVTIGDYTATVATILDAEDEEADDSDEDEDEDDKVPVSPEDLD